MVKSIKKSLKKSIILLLCICLVTSFFTGFHSVVSAASIIQNGGFEYGYWAWKTGGSIDTTVKHSGNQSFKMVGRTSDQYMVSGLVPVNASEVYEFSAWIKTADISTPDGAVINILMVDANDKGLGWCNGTMKLIKTGGTQDWTRYSIDIGNFIKGTAYLKIYVRVDANVTGTAWFDDVELNRTLRNYIPNGGFEYGYWAWKTGGSIDTSVKYGGSQSFKMVGDENEQYMVSGGVPVDTKEAYELSAWIKTSDISTPDGVSLNALMVDANDKGLRWCGNGQMKLIKTGGTQEWTKYTASIDEFAPGTAYLKIYLRVDKNITGTAWFDNIELKLKKIVFGVNGPVGNIFFSDDPLKMNLSLINHDILDKSVHVNYKVSDSNSVTVTSGNMDVQIKPGESISKEMDLSAVSKYDLYTLEVNATGDNGNINISKTLPFSKVLASSEPLEDGIFAAAAHMGWDEQNMKENLMLAAKAGIKWVRDDARWNLAETVKGQINILPFWDKYVDTALSYGIKPLLIIDYGNPLYDEGKVPYTEEGIAAYANYAAKVAEHFMGRVDHFEIWNEYNIAGTDPNKTPETYVKMLKAAYTAIKEVNPNAVVIGCASTDIVFVKRVLAAGGYNYMDAVSTYPYTCPTSPEDGGFVRSLEAIRELFESYGPAKPLWATEIGWPTQNAENSGVSELLSGAYAVRMYTLALGSGLVDKIFWYDFQNDGVSSTWREANFGLIRAWQNETVPCSAKANYLAYSAFTSKISGADFVKAYKPSEDTYVYKFHRNSDNKDILVAWRNSDSSEIMLKPGTSDAVLYDMFGNEGEVTKVDGTINLPVSQIPVYLEGSFSQDMEIIEPYSIQIIPTPKRSSEGVKWNIDIGIKNNLSTQLTGKIKLLEPSLWDSEDSEKSFDLQAMTSKVVSFEFPGIPEDKLYNLKAQISLDKGTSVIIERGISFIFAQKAYKVPVIDGIISKEEWEGAMPLNINKASQVKMITDWGGETDLSGKGYIKWDKDNFYLSLEVKDNVHVVNNMGSDIWQDDSIQFCIDPCRKSQLSGLGYDEIGIALNRNTKSVIKWRWTAVTGRVNGDLKNMKCEIKRDDNSGITTYELSMPWSDLLPDGIAAVNGSDFGFSMLINDNDGSGRRGWMEYMSGIGYTKDISMFGDMILADMPTLESVTLSANKTILKSGETALLSVSGIIEDGSQADLSQAKILYTSDNDKVATVDNIGKVTAAGEGIANIKALVTLNGITKENSVQILVDNTPPEFTLMVNGNILKEGDSFEDCIPLTFKVYDNLSGVASARMSVGDSVYADIKQAPYSVDIDFAGNVGKWMATVTTEDIAGNIIEKTFEFSVTTSIDSMRYLMELYIKAGELNKPLTDQLSNNLNQAQHQLDIGRPEDAAKHMEDFIKHLNNSALENSIKGNAKNVLNADAEALIEMWSVENK